MALALFLIWERSSWQVTTSPVGTWVMRTAESVVLTPCPPGPEDRYTSTRMSFSSTLMSTSSASGRTATVTVEVWMRPLDSVAGTRWTRWTPRSNLSRLQAPRPWMKRHDLLEAPHAGGVTVHHLDLPPLTLRVLCRTCARDRRRRDPPRLPPHPRGSPRNVPVVVGILGDEEGTELVLELGLPRRKLGHLRLRHLTHLAVGVLGGHVAGLFEPGEELLVLLELAHHLGELRRRLAVLA
jgi:hypothetical protein